MRTEKTVDEKSGGGGVASKASKASKAVEATSEEVVRLEPKKAAGTSTDSSALTMCVDYQSSDTAEGTPATAKKETSSVADGASIPSYPLTVRTDNKKRDDGTDGSQIGWIRQDDLKENDGEVSIAEAVTVSFSDSEDDGDATKKLDIVWESIESRPDSESPMQGDTEVSEENVAQRVRTGSGQDAGSRTEVDSEGRKVNFHEEAEEETEEPVQVDESHGMSVLRDSCEDFEMKEDSVTEDVDDIANYIRQPREGRDKLTKDVEQLEKSSSTDKKPSRRKKRPLNRRGPNSASKRKQPRGARSDQPTTVTTSSASTSRKANLTNIKNWRKVLKLVSPCPRQEADQILGPASLAQYIPCIPVGTSGRLVRRLGQVDMLCCPACKDRFVAPTSFFQHVYRRSIKAVFRCKPCGDKVITFFNRLHRHSLGISRMLRCHLKMHALSHMETDGTSVVAGDLLRVCPLSLGDSDFGPSNWTRHLDEAHEMSLDSCPAQCPECRVGLPEGPAHLEAHFQEVKKSTYYECERNGCSFYVTNRCALSAHMRLHDSLRPYVCPECGQEFFEFSSLASHSRSSCHHEARILVFECGICVAARKRQVWQKANEDSPFIPASELLSHVYDSHIRLLYRCTKCPRAFADKALVYRHGEEASHQSKTIRSPPMPEFALLYRATFLKAPGNLFCSRDTLEEKLDQVSKKWERKFVFRCAGCQAFYNNKGEFSAHNHKWCQMQHHKMESLSYVSLFDGIDPERDWREKKLKLETLLKELKSLVGASGEPLLNDFGMRITQHLNDPNSKDKKSELPEDMTYDGDHPQQDSERNSPMKRERYALRLTSRTSSSGGNACAFKTDDDMHNERILSEPEVTGIKVEIFQQDDPKVTPKLSSPSESPQKAVGKVKHEIVSRKSNGPNFSSVKQKASKRRGANIKSFKGGCQPLGETLGLDLPSTRSMLAFNRLDKTAILLGSSVVKKGSDREAAAFSCGLCDFSTDSQVSFRAHIRVHRPSRFVGFVPCATDFFQCKVCGMSFASKTAWKKHLFLLHRLRHPSPSDCCSDLAASPSKMNKSSDPFSFPEDDGSSGELKIDDGVEEEDTNKKAIRSHANSAEEKDAIFKPRKNVCAVCARAFSTPLELRRHFRGHGMAYLNFSSGGSLIKME